jgi:hypothetical protein
MQEALVAWRAAHPAASFDEIAEEVGKQREVLMGQLLAELAGQHGVGAVLLERSCRIAAGCCGAALAHRPCSLCAAPYSATVGPLFSLLSPIPNACPFCWTHPM